MQQKERRKKDGRIIILITYQHLPREFYSKLKALRCCARDEKGKIMGGGRVVVVSADRRSDVRRYMLVE
jgi:hypothetical protein